MIATNRTLVGRRVVELDSLGPNDEMLDFGRAAGVEWTGGKTDRGVVKRDCQASSFFVWTMGQLGGEVIAILICT